jgi:hypothetical protein
MASPAANIGDPRLPPPSRHSDHEHGDMGAGTAPGLSHEGGSRTRARIGRTVDALARRATDGIRHPSPFTRALAVVVLTVTFVSALTYYGAREFAGRAAESRGAAEAQSIASHSGRLATGDAYAAYLQILRFAADPVVASPVTTAPERRGALHQLLFENTNMFDSLVVADLRGRMLTTTDASISGVRGSEAYLEARATVGPANSDIMLDADVAYVEFAAPLLGADGEPWGILVGRSTPGRVWTNTLHASVDGSRNVILNSDGRFSAGVAESAIGTPWRGQPLPNGTVRADISGTDSICGLHAIGRDTIIDRGWNVAACLPVALVRGEHSQAIGNLALVTLAGAVLAIIVTGGALRFVLQARPPLLMLPSPSGDVTHPDENSGTTGQPTPAAADTAEARRGATVQPGALALIEAYEERNARVAAHLREAVRAKLLTGTTQAGESYRLAPTDPAIAKDLHDRAMQQLDEARERDLRHVSQEIHPDLVRLGLPAALRGLARDLADVIDLVLDVDFTADAVDGGDDRRSLDDGRRRAAYRLALDAARTLASAGAAMATLRLRREDGRLELSLEAETSGEVEPERLTASRLTLEAYGGDVTAAAAAGHAFVRGTLPVE